jgi:hypothetical protein
VERTAGALLTREQAAHPLFAELVDLSRWAESMATMNQGWLQELVAAKQKAWAASENEPQEPAEADEAEKEFLKEQKHLTPRRKGAKTQRKQSTFSFERVRRQNKKLLEIDVRSRKVIENTGNKDILSCDLSDILGNSTPVLTENAHSCATKITFSMRFNRQCTALAMPRCESHTPPDARRTNCHRLALDVVRPVRLAACNTETSTGPLLSSEKGPRRNPARSRIPRAACWWRERFHWFLPLTAGRDSQKALAAFRLLPTAYCLVPPGALRYNERTWRQSPHPRAKASGANSGPWHATR